MAWAEAHDAYKSEPAGGYYERGPRDSESWDRRFCSPACRAAEVGALPGGFGSESVLRLGAPREALVMRTTFLVADAEGVMREIPPEALWRVFHLLRKASHHLPPSSEVGLEVRSFLAGLGG